MTLLAILCQVRVGSHCINTAFHFMSFQNPQKIDLGGKINEIEVKVVGFIFLGERSSLSQVFCSVNSVPLIIHCLFSKVVISVNAFSSIGESPGARNYLVFLVEVGRTA